MTLCQTKILCPDFKDNNGALKLARFPKFRPRAKLINIKYWRFIDHVKQHNIEILPFETKDQLTDIFTKQLLTKVLEKLRDGIQGIDRKGRYYPPCQTKECGNYTYMSLDRLVLGIRSFH